jgi:hypothetical protein
MSRPGYAETQQQGHNLLRAQLLKAAGIDFDRQARLLQKAVNKLESKLDAKKIETASFEGKITDTLEVEDHAAQLRASEAIADLLGAKPSKQTGDGQGDVIIHITFPQACQPTTAIDLSAGQTPLQVVGEVQSSEPLSTDVNEINEIR